MIMSEFVLSRKLSSRAACKFIQGAPLHVNRRAFKGDPRGRLLIQNVSWDIETKVCRVLVQVLVTEPRIPREPYRWFREIDFNWLLRGFQKQGANR